MNTKDRWNDPLVIQRLKEKERTVVRDFIRDHEQNIFRICFGFLHNREDAEELTQDVFMQVFNNIEKFRGDCKLITWIYRICYTRSLNRISKNKWQKWVQSLDQVLFLPTDSVNNGPENRLETKETGGMIHRAVDRLPDMQKLAFVLHHYEELKYLEIARVMEISVGAVESLIFRAKKNLQKRLKGEL